MVWTIAQGRYAYCLSILEYNIWTSHRERYSLILNATKYNYYAKKGNAIVCESKCRMYMKGSHYILDMSILISAY